MRHVHSLTFSSLALVSAAFSFACAAQPAPEAIGVPASSRLAVDPGITVLMEDSLHLVRGKRIGLLTNQTGRNAAGVSDIDLLYGAAAKAANVRLIRLYAPEHGIRGTEDRELPNDSVDEKTGLRIISLYTRGTVAPPDSTLRDLDALVFDLQDIGTRTWTYVGVMVYAP
jgi:uncharacterized protein YbbC (DUF1343 family)